MPRNTRNFWIEGAIDGRTTIIKGGPTSKGGGFELRVKMRDSGDIVDDALIVRGIAKPCGELYVVVEASKQVERKKSWGGFTLSTHR